jgi:hypothetical protein
VTSVGAVTIVIAAQYLNTGSTPQVPAANFGSTTSGNQTAIDLVSNQAFASDIQLAGLAGPSLVTANRYGIGAINNGASSAIQVGSTLVTSGTALNIQTTVGNFRIGATENPTTNPVFQFTSDVDEVEVWSCALTSTELGEAINVVRTTWNTL